MSRGLWKCAGRADLRQIAGVGPIAMNFSIIPVSDFWGQR